jgi:soluble lytic murein transglycosylase-like protein
MPQLNRAATGLLLFRAMSFAQTPPPSQPPSNPSASDRQMESAAKQRAASQAQTSPAPEGSFFSSGWASPAVLQLPASGPNCPPLSGSDSDSIISKAATQYKLNPDLIRAVIRQESAFYPCAVSDKGAIGLMQLMPDTVSTLKVADPFDPAQNIDSGARYMKQLLGRFKGDLKLALAAYNAGPEKVDGPKPAVPNIAETREYVDQIVKALNGAPAETTPTP